MDPRNSDNNKLFNSKLSYVKLGYHYNLLSNIFLILSIVSLYFFNKYNLMKQFACMTSLILLVILYFFKTRPKEVYLLDFSCYKPDSACKTSWETFLNVVAKIGTFSEVSKDFKKKILEKSGLGQETYLSKSILRSPTITSMEELKNEAKVHMVGAIDELLAKTRVNIEDVGILIVNTSLFNTAPSLSAMVINHYNFKDDIKSFNLSAMGCGASLISIDLAKRILQVQASTYALVVSSEYGSQSNVYLGNDRSMLMTNCIFRSGASAILLSNKPSDRNQSKYELIHTVRTHTGSDDKSYSCAYQKEDEHTITGISLSKNLISAAGEALKTNISALGRLVLPMSEQLLFVATLVARTIFRMKTVKPYVPNFKLAFEHFCIHPGGKAVLDAVEKSLMLSKWHMEPSRMTLYRFGNISSPALWYEMAYMEAKGRINKGDRIWQIGFGSGFKCTSIVWRALKTVNPAEKNPWMDEIDNFPVHDSQ